MIKALNIKEAIMSGNDMSKNYANQKHDYLFVKFLKLTIINNRIYLKMFQPMMTYSTEIILIVL